MSRFPILSLLLLTTACDDGQNEAALRSDLDAALSRVDELEAVLAASSRLTLANPIPVATDAPTFREVGPPHGSYISTWNAKPIHLAEACAAMSSCLALGDPPLMLTFSYYDPDVSISDDWVLGVGWSAIGKGPLVKCLAGKWKANKGTEF